MSRRAWAHRVAERLGHRDLDILRTLREFRLLSGPQIRRLYFPGTHIPTQSRKARSTLHRLATFNLIIRLPRRIGGVHAGSEGFIFGLSGLGHAVLDLGESDPRRHRSISMTKPAFEAHTLAVSELVVMLIEQSRHEPFTIQELFGEPRCWRRFSGLGGEIRILKPDAYIRLILGDFESTAFIELDLGSESLPTISRKCSTYIDYWNSGTEQRIHGVFPRVWWLVPDLQRQRAISATIRRLPEEARGLFAVGLTTESPALLTQLPKTQGGPQ